MNPDRCATPSSLETHTASPPDRNTQRTMSGTSLHWVLANTSPALLKSWESCLSFEFPSPSPLILPKKNNPLLSSHNAMGNTETAIRFEKLQQTRQNRKQPNQKKLPKKEEVALSFVLRMCVGSSDSHFALMTADPDANLVSRYILIPLLLSDCVFVFFYPFSFFLFFFSFLSFNSVFPKYLRKIPGVCCVSPFIILFSLSVPRYETTRMSIYVLSWQG